MIGATGIQLGNVSLSYRRLFLVLGDALVVTVQELLVCVELSRGLRSILRCFSCVALHILDIILINETIHPCISRPICVGWDFICILGLIVLVGIAAIFLGHKL